MNMAYVSFGLARSVTHQFLPRLRLSHNGAPMTGVHTVEWKPCFKVGAPLALLRIAGHETSNDYFTSSTGRVGC